MRLYADTSWWLALLSFDKEQLALAEAAGLAVLNLSPKHR
jgi:hypothetical protein